MPCPRAASPPSAGISICFLWIICVVHGLSACFTLSLVSTQNNAQMFRLQIDSGRLVSASICKTVLDRNIARSDVQYLCRGDHGHLWQSCRCRSSVVWRWSTSASPASRLYLVLSLPRLMVPRRGDRSSPLFRLVALELGWGNSLGLPWLCRLWQALPEYFLFRQHFASITPELSEAAQLDGAGPAAILAARALAAKPQHAVTAHWSSSCSSAAGTAICGPC